MLEMLFLELWMQKLLPAMPSRQDFMSCLLQRDCWRRMQKCKPQVKDINPLLLSLGNNDDKEKDPLLLMISGKCKTTKQLSYCVFDKDMLSEEEENHGVVKWCSDAKFKRGGARTILIPEILEDVLKTAPTKALNLQGNKRRKGLKVPPLAKHQTRLSRATSTPSAMGMWIGMLILKIGYGPSSFFSFALLNFGFIFVEGKNSTLLSVGSCP